MTRGATGIHGYQGEFWGFYILFLGSEVQCLSQLYVHSCFIKIQIMSPDNFPPGIKELDAPAWAHTHTHTHTLSPTYRVLLPCSRQVVSSSFATPWTVAHLAPPSMGFPRQEYWSGLPFRSPRGLPKPGIEPASPASSTLVGRCFTSKPPGKPPPMNYKPPDMTTSCFWTGTRATQGLPHCEQNPSLGCPDYRWSRDGILMSQTGHKSLSFIPYSPFMIDFCRVNWSIFAKPQGYETARFYFFLGTWR